MGRPKRDIGAVLLYIVEWEDWMGAHLGPYKIFKLCTRCKQKKPVSEFYKDSRAKDGLHIECKTCDKSQAKKWAKKNKKRHYNLKRGI